MIVNYPTRQIRVLEQPPHRLVRRPNPHLVDTAKSSVGAREEPKRHEVVLKSCHGARCGSSGLCGVPLSLFWLEQTQPYADKRFQFRVGVL